MAEKLKNLLNAQVVRSIAKDLRGTHPPFRDGPFVKACLAGLEELELTQRARHIADAMHLHLPRPFAAAAAVLVDSLGPELTRSDQFGLAPLRYMPHVFFVQKYGLEDFETSMLAQYELTKRFSAESSIRAFLVRYPAETYSRLLQWALDGNVHVRRLVSEGTRPRLPWAPRLAAFQTDSAPVIALLESLKDDPERYVQRSVANNLNDISKDHPDLAVEVCRRWIADASVGRKWIVRHALRSLAKRGHPGALQVIGVGGKPRVRIHRARISPTRAELGSTVRFSFEIENVGRTRQELLIDYAVHFVKANGQTRAKVFKLRRLILAPAQRVEFGDSISFKPMTTRQHYPGRHRIDLLINGVVHPLAEFHVR
jgi:3-methyladenine DNA glycosylase AlkC